MMTIEFEQHAEKIADDKVTQYAYSLDEMAYGRRAAKERLRPKVKQQLIKSCGLSAIGAIYYFYQIWTWVNWIIKRIRESR